MPICIKYDTEVYDVMLGQEYSRKLYYPGTNVFII
jgi:hypothetical protein